MEAYKALPAAEREKTDPMKFVFDGIRLVVSLCCLDWTVCGFGLHCCRAAGFICVGMWLVVALGCPGSGSTTSFDRHDAALLIGLT